MNAEPAWGLLDRIEVLRHPPDVDLLIFFARHPALRRRPVRGEEVEEDG
jgi:hypothetical protein